MGIVLLVRHGQASWGAENYDQLSEIGWEQGRILGKALAERGIQPDLIVSGSMQRHQETCEGVLESLGKRDVQIDAGWNEFNHTEVFSKVNTKSGFVESLEDFEAAMNRWTGGEHSDYGETFGDFTTRVNGALRRTSEEVGDGVAIVFTSGGPTSWTATSVLGGEAPLWLRLNPACANTGVTKIAVRPNWTHLMTFNETVHIEAHMATRPELLTYR
jgi:broad specificity phosphatase PhoE